MLHFHHRPDFNFKDRFFEESFWKTIRQGILRHNEQNVRPRTLEIPWRLAVDFKDLIGAEIMGLRVVLAVTDRIEVCER